MKINEIIRKKRLAKGLTQEQAASRLGVSPPAVNKWEKGVTYPDITLLPALARLLDTDLNTLLSFQEELSDQEIEAFQNELLAAAETEGTQKAFALAMEKLREFPSCDTLVLSTALTLEGLICFYGNRTATRRKTYWNACMSRRQGAPMPRRQIRQRSCFFKIYGKTGV